MELHIVKLLTFLLLIKVYLSVVYVLNNLKHSNKYVKINTNLKKYNKNNLLKLLNNKYLHHHHHSKKYYKSKKYHNKKKSISTNNSNHKNHPINSLINKINSKIIHLTKFKINSTTSNYKIHQLHQQMLPNPTPFQNPPHISIPKPV